MLAATVRLPEIAGLGLSEVVQDIETFLVRPNVRFLRAYGRRVPDVLDSEAVYQKERDEEWLTIPYIIEAGSGDCEDWAAWLAAEDRVKRGYASRVVLYNSRPRLEHAVVARPRDCPLGRWEPWCILVSPSFYILDPSRAKGMSSSSGTRKYRFS